MKNSNPGIRVRIAVSYLSDRLVSQDFADGLLLPVIQYFLPLKIRKNVVKKICYNPDLSVSHFTMNEVCLFSGLKTSFLVSKKWF